MRKKNVFILLTLIFSLCFGFTSKTISEVEAGANEYSSLAQKYLSENNDISSFYTSSSAGSVSGLKGDNLLEKLAQIMEVKHRYYTSYGDVRGAMCYSDEDPNNSSNIILFYAGASFSNAWGSGNNYNREHVWCKNRSGGLYTSVDNSSRGAGADIHQLRPSNPSVNSSRSNNLYAELNKTGNELTYNGNGIDCYNSGSGQFEPRDGIKGDVARILMYMYTHYSTEIDVNSSRASISNTSTTSQAGDLQINNIVYTSLNTSQAAWDVLLSWNELDPVDDFEMNRNNYCASITGVRNPYIDHPEFAEMIWSSSYEGSGALIDNIPQKEYISVPYILTSLGEGDTFQIKPSTNIEGNTISYSSSNTSIASVTSSGLITAKGIGKTTITISCKEETTSFVVSVYEQKYLTLLEESLTLKEGESYQITPNTNVSSLTYSSKDKEIATVSSSGKISALTPGSTTISVEGDGLIATISLIVIPSEDNTTVRYTVTSKTDVSTSRNAPIDSYASFLQTAGTSNGQATAGNTTELKLSGYQGYIIKDITISTKSNTSKGAGSFSVSTSLGKTLVSIPDSKFNTSNWNGSYTTSFVEKKLTLLDENYVIQEGEVISFLLTGSTNSIYIESYIITYELFTEGEKTLDDVFKEYYNEGLYTTSTSYFFNEESQIEMTRYFNVNLEDNNNKIDLSRFINNSYFASWEENAYEISSIDDETLLDFVSVISTDLKKIVEDSYYLDISKITISGESTYLSIKLELTSLDLGKLEDESLTFVEVKVFVEE